MRRSLILTVAAAVSMVLLAMLVPMAVLLRSYALEDRLSRAALEVQATETVVSQEDKGAVAAYLDQVNRDPHVQTTVLYPPSQLHPEGEAIGPTPGEDAEVALARRTGQASVNDVGGGAEILVPVSLGRSSAAPGDTPVIRVEVRPPGLESDILRAWLVLLALGVVLLAAALLLADRLGRFFVNPIRRLATYATTLGDRRNPEPLPAAGPHEVLELTTAMNRLVQRIEELLERERAGIADLSHRLRTPMTALRLRVEALPGLDDRDRLSHVLDELQATVDHVVREARRSEREGLVPRVDGVAALVERARFWEPLAQEQERPFRVVVESTQPIAVRAAEEDLHAVVDVLLDNVFTHTPPGSGVVVRVGPRAAGGVTLVVEDGGPGFGHHPEVLLARGRSGAGSTGLGLAIAERTARESGGTLGLESHPGGGRVVVGIGPPA